jgi:hypothetical protein
MSYLIDLNNPAALKRIMREEGRKALPAAHIDEIIDLSVHAAIEAFKTVHRIAGTASEGATSHSVQITGFSLLGQLVEAKLEEIKKDLAAQGITLHQAEIAL